MHVSTSLTGVTTLPALLGVWGEGALPVGELSVAAAAVLVMLVLVAYWRRRWQPLAAVRASLLALSRGESEPGALAVVGTLGPEAEAWNDLLDRHAALRDAAALGEAREQFTGRSDQAGLAAGCDAIGMGLVLIDERDQCSYANDAAAVLLQKPRQQIIGSPADMLELPSALAEALGQVTGGVRRKLSGELACDESGATGVLRYCVYPVRGSQRHGAMIVLEDITQQRIADEAKHQFVAQATHELRTPLTNIRLYVETAQEDGENDPSLLGQCLNVINRESLRLERLVGDMLSVAEIEAGALRLNRDDVRVGEMIEEIEHGYAAQAKEKKIEFAADVAPKLPVLHGDRDKLMLAMQNLVGNAVKYTPEGGRVTVRAALEESELVLAVSDTGIGISEEETRRIFDRFYRAQDKRLANITGTGLGLALAREVVRLHGGEISVESEINEGSTFTIRLPVQESAAA